MIRRVSFKEFEKRARAVWGNQFIYEEKDFINMNTKMKMYCTKHHEYKDIPPTSHIHDMRGCNGCRKEKKQKIVSMSPEQMYERAIEIHGTDKFDYSNTIFKDRKTIFHVKCNICGITFPASPQSHLSRTIKTGCPNCTNIRLSKAYRTSQDEFIATCREVHNDLYEYPEGVTIYRGNDEEIQYICPVHGLVSQLASTHRKGHKCSKCVRNRMYTIEDIRQYLQDNKEEFSDIELLSTEYFGNKHNLKWRCKNKGCNYEWEACWLSVKGSDEKKGSRCMPCFHNNQIGFINYTTVERKKDELLGKMGYCYILNCCDEKEEFLKIGITYQNIKRRFACKTLMPYKYKIIHKYCTNYYNAFYIEQYLHDICKDKKYIPQIAFGGKNECFSEIPPIEEIEKHIQDVLTSIENNTHRDHLN